MLKIFVEEGSPKTKRTIVVRYFFFAVCLFLLAGSAHANPITCPAYPANISASLGAPPPGEPQVVSVTPSVSLTGGATAVLCTYTVQITPVYTPTGLNPINLFRCPSFPLTMTILTPDNPPMAGFSAWGFGAPGTAEGSSTLQSSPQAVEAVFSRIFLHLDGRLASVTSCRVINSGIFTFAIYSTIATGDTCTSSGGTVSCTAPPPPPCPGTVPGSNMPTGVCNPNSSKFGYLADDTIIFNADNAIPIDPPSSMSTIKSAMGASFNSASFILVNPQASSPGEGFPAPAFLCVYDSPQFEYMRQPAKAQVTVGCSGSCGSL